MRAEEDLQATGAQAVTIEDSLSHIHGSIGRRQPASRAPPLRGRDRRGARHGDAAAEPALRWHDWTGDYGLVRDLIAATYPDEFHDFNDRMFTPGGFYRGNAARERTLEDRQRQGRVHRARGADRAGGAAGAPGR